MSEVFIYFLRLGLVGFGGPLALIAQMQKDLVEEREWISREEFIQVFALIKSMPGPVAFQVAVFLGNRRSGFWGAVLAAFGMIFPSFLLMIALAAFYDGFIQVPWMKTLMLGMQMGALALIFSGLLSLTRSFFSERLFWLLLVLGGTVFFMMPFSEPLFIFGSGFLALALRKKSPIKRFWATGVAVGVPTGVFAASSSALLDLFMICLKAGAFVFGTGLAIIPLLESDFVIKQQWLTHQQFLDALAFGQLTPGPVVITVTFIGYKVAGFLGAALATLGVFAPAFIHMTTWFPRAVKWLSRQTWIRTFTLGVTAAVAATILISLVSITQGWELKFWLGSALLFALITKLKLPGWLLIFCGGALAFVI